MGLSRFLAVLVVFSAPAALVGCEFIDTGTNNAADAATGDAASSVDAGASVVGAGCGTEQKSGVELCVATSKCPDIVVDTQALPSCGFRIHGSAVDLVCACGSSLCPMGVFATCAEATQLLTNQTESSVCVQVAEGRCTDTSAAAPSSSTSTKVCDRQCMKDCGGGAGCASVCNCD